MPAITQARIPPVGGPLQFASGTTNSLSIGAAASAVVAAVSSAAGVTRVSAIGGADITVTGSPITGIGTLVFGLSTTGVTPGTYSQVVVDSRGRVTSGGLGIITAIDDAVVATGTVQASAYAITKDFTVFASVPAAGEGGRLPNNPNTSRVVKNADQTNAVTIWPFTGGTIDHNSANASVLIEPGAAVTFVQNSTTQIYSS